MPHKVGYIIFLAYFMRHIYHALTQNFHWDLRRWRMHFSRQFFTWMRRK